MTQSREQYVFEKKKYEGTSDKQEERLQPIDNNEVQLRSKRFDGRACILKGT